MQFTGHLHHVSLEQRDGGSFITFEIGPDFREACEKLRFEHKAALPLHRIPTTVAATPAIVTAFNQGDASFLRADAAARAVRLALTEYLQAHQSDDPYCAMVSDDLRRHASSALCVE